MDELVKLLAYFNQREKATQLQRSFKVFLQTVKESFPLFEPLPLTTPPPNSTNSARTPQFEHLFQGLRFA